MSSWTYKTPGCARPDVALLELSVCRLEELRLELAALLAPLEELLEEDRAAVYFAPLLLASSAEPAIHMRF